MKWSLATADPSKTATLKGELGCSELMARLLINRGLANPEHAYKFLHPSLSDLHDPALMCGLPRAVERILEAVEKHEKILIYGDYDVDGMTAVVILRKAIQMLGGEVRYHIPRRLIDGYGMKEDVIERAAAEGFRLVISVDTGIRSFEVVRAASALGLDTIITDHHLPEEDEAGQTEIPQALAVLNPKRSDCGYPNENLCGCGVAFKVVQALLQKTNRLSLLPSFLKIVAIGTVADVVPLVGENRVIVKFGLERLAQPANVGLKALLEISGLKDKKILSSDIGFRIAPRINAVGRMGGANEVVELFSTDDESVTRSLAEKMNQMNSERQQIEQHILQSIDEQLTRDPALTEDLVMVLAGEGWHRGVIGIAASKVLEKYHRPTLILACEDGVAQGSGRSIKAFHLLRALDQVQDLFTRYGGHSHAVGFSLPVERIAELRQRLNAYARAVLTPEDLIPSLEIDAEVRLSDLDDQLYAEMVSLEPYGEGNPVPTFVARDLRMVYEPRILKEKHLKLRVEQDGVSLDALGWGMGARLNGGAGRGREISMAFQLNQNTFQAVTSLQLTIKDFE
ncbi:MAG: single-stranded-DNA-specific exonuclease RecJ [Acidobacteriia bacterium]|nr:single-stranded-DNA-specific exonuclease RecJ [Terriglobia bacterium]